MEEKKRLSILTNGIIKENPVLVLVIGTCPTLATSLFRLFTTSFPIKSESLALSP